MSGCLRYATGFSALAFASCLVLGASAANAAVVISTNPTSNISCSSGVCTPSAAAAILNVNDLENDLVASSVKITTHGALAKDIHVSAALNWTSANTLTLDAYRSVAIYAPVADMGAGGLSLLTDDGGVDGTLSFGVKGNVTFLNTSDNLTINGTVYTLADSVKTLANAIDSNLAGSFALANSYNAKPDGTYTQAPINYSFSGTFEGLGNTISNLTISSSTGAGLFRDLLPSATVRDLALKSAIVSAHRCCEAGVLVGDNDGGYIIACYASGRVYMDKYKSGGTAVAVGGLVGDSHNGAEIADSVANVSVREHGNSVAVGGLVGANDYSSVILNSFAEGPVSVIATSGIAYVGGLVGSNDGGIEESYSSGAVSGGPNALVGGLVAKLGGDGGCQDSYWDTTTSGTGTSACGAGMTTAQLQTGLPPGFSSSIWAEAPMVIDGLPYLKDLPR